jgi:hypothetical protein
MRTFLLSSEVGPPEEFPDEYLLKARQSVNLDSPSHLLVIGLICKTPRFQGFALSTPLGDVPDEAPVFQLKSGEVTFS